MKGFASLHSITLALLKLVFYETLRVSLNQHHPSPRARYIISIAVQLLLLLPCATRTTSDILSLTQVPHGGVQQAGGHLRAQPAALPPHPDGRHEGRQLHRQRPGLRQGHPEKGRHLDLAGFNGNYNIEFLYNKFKLG